MGQGPADFDGMAMVRLIGGNQDGNFLAPAAAMAATNLGPPDRLDALSARRPCGHLPEPHHQPQHQRIAEPLGI